MAGFDPVGSVPVASIGSSAVHSATYTPAAGGFVFNGYTPSLQIVGPSTAVYQVARETLGDDAGLVRVHQLSRETLGDDQGRVRVYQLAREALGDDVGRVRVHQLAREALGDDVGQVRVYQLVRETLRSSATVSTWIPRVIRY